jgi:diacylglycerol kinase (ATP)
MTTTDVRAVLVTCTGSVSGTAARVADSVETRLRASVTRLDQVVPESAEQLTATMREAVNSGADLLVVLGGDGAAHVAVQACASSETALAVLPGGTGNDLARALGMPRDPVTAAETLATLIREGTRTPMDVGRLADGRLFATVLCAGFDSAVNERVNRMRWPHGPRRYDLAIVAELTALRTHPMVVTTEDQRIELDATLVAIGNTSWYGGGVPICPGADSGDGLFDLTIVGRTRRADLLRILPKLRSGTHIDHPAVTTMRAREVSLAGGADVIGYADGERMRSLPIEVTCEAGALTVVGRPEAATATPA